jgi:hypothetical protein
MPGFSLTRKIGNSLVLPMQVTVDGAALVLTGKTLAYRLYGTDGETVLLEFTVANGRLAVTDAAQGLIELTASSADMTLDAGTYLGCLELTDGNDADYCLELPDDEEGDLWTFINQLTE